MRDDTSQETHVECIIIMYMYIIRTMYNVYASVCSSYITAVNYCLRHPILCILILCVCAYVGLVHVMQGGFAQTFITDMYATTETK